MNKRQISPVRNVLEIIGAIIIAPYAILLFVANPMMWILGLSGGLTRRGNK